MIYVYLHQFCRQHAWMPLHGMKPAMHARGDHARDAHIARPGQRLSIDPSHISRAGASYLTPVLLSRVLGN
jgi:hypothetical protein